MHIFHIHLHIFLSPCQKTSKCTTRDYRQTQSRHQYTCHLHALNLQTTRGTNDTSETMQGLGCSSGSTERALILATRKPRGKVHPSAAAFYRKRDGTIFAQNKPLIKPQALSRDDKQFLWDNLQLQKLGWNKQVLLDKFKELDQAANPIQAIKWCV